MQLTPTAGAAGVNGSVPMCEELTTEGRRSTDDRSRSQVRTGVHAMVVAVMPPVSCGRLQLDWRAGCARALSMLPLDFDRARGSS
jgi:hypothetical protein